MDFVNWYKNKIESSNLEPPETVWENVQDQLDIDNSWQKINSHLEQNAVPDRKLWYAVAAGLLILIMAGGYWWFSSDNLKMEKQIAEKIMFVEEDLNKQATEKKEIQTLQKGEKQPFIEEQKVSHSITPQESTKLAQIVVEEQKVKEVKKQETLHPSDEQFQDNGRLIAALKPYASDIESLPVQERDLLVVAEPYESDKDVRQERVAFQKIYAGATGQLANTWVLNEKTYTGMEKSSLIASNASFGSNFGVFAGTNLSRNLFAQLDLNVITQNKQDYNEYLNGQYISNEMKFNYSQVGFSLRYIAFSNRYMKGEHHVYAGGYWGYLHSATQKVDHEIINITNDYARSDYGVFLGYEYIFPIYKNLGFGTGVKASYGLSNIYSGNQYIPSYLNKTHNASLNITFSLKYSIK